MERWLHSMFVGMVFRAAFRYCSLPWVSAAPACTGMGQAVRGPFVFEERTSIQYPVSIHADDHLWMRYFQDNIFDADHVASCPPKSLMQTSLTFALS